jgi:hypothetical protein
VGELISKRVTRARSTNQYMEKFCHCLKTLSSTQHTITSEFSRYSPANFKITKKIISRPMLIQFYLFFVFIYTHTCVHSLRGMLETSVAEEKKFNPRLTKTIDEFVDIMNNLNLPYPKQIGKH